MDNVRFAPEFILAAVNAEIGRAANKSAELNRLGEIGYRDSQTGLDIARDVKAHLSKTYDLLGCIDEPEARLLQDKMVRALINQDMIIKHIELSL